MSEAPSLIELIRQGLMSMEDGYDDLAPKFEHTPFRTPDEMLAPVVAALDPVPRTLDLCCGTGAVTRAFAPVTTERLVGLDMSVGMLEQARAQMPASDLDVEFIQGDALATGLPEGSFDRVTSFGAFGHILEEDEPTFCDEIVRLLAPGGEFVYVTARLEDIGPRIWIARAFNAVMRVRNALIKPPFVMYYLTFRLERSTQLLRERGLQVEVYEELFEAPFSVYKLVRARKPADPTP